MMIRKMDSGNQGLILQDLDELRQFAHIFSQTLRAGDWIALTGDLGSGKTTFTRFLGEALGVAQDMHSPTFTLFNHYAGLRFALLHGDWYRLQTEEMEALWDEIEAEAHAPDTIIVTEWADKAPELKPRWTWALHFEHVSDMPDARKVTLTCLSTDDRLESVVEALGHA